MTIQNPKKDTEERKKNAERLQLDEVEQTPYFELIDSEISYMGSISEILSHKEGLLEKLKKRTVKKLGQEFKTPRDEQAYNKLIEVFDVLEKVKAESEKILSSFEKGDPLSWSQALTEIKSQYQKYVEKYSNFKAVAKGTHLLAKADKYLTKKAGSQLDSFLIAPVQRLPRYPIVVGEILKKSEDFPKRVEAQKELIKEFTIKNQKLIQHGEDIIKLEKTFETVSKELELLTKEYEEREKNPEKGKRIVKRMELAAQLDGTALKGEEKEKIKKELEAIKLEEKEYEDKSRAVNNQKFAKSKEKATLAKSLKQEDIKEENEKLKKMQGIAQSEERPKKQKEFIKFIGTTKDVGAEINYIQREADLRNLKEDLIRNIKTSIDTSKSKKVRAMLTYALSEVEKSEEKIVSVPSIIENLTQKTPKEGEFFVQGTRKINREKFLLTLRNIVSPELNKINEGYQSEVNDIIKKGKKESLDKPSEPKAPQPPMSPRVSAPPLPPRPLRSSVRPPLPSRPQKSPQHISQKPTTSSVSSSRGTPLPILPRNKTQEINENAIQSIAKLIQNLGDRKDKLKDRMLNVILEDLKIQAKTGKPIDISASIESLKKIADKIKVTPELFNQKLKSIMPDLVNIINETQAQQIKEGIISSPSRVKPELTTSKLTSSPPRKGGPPQYPPPIRPIHQTTPLSQVPQQVVFTPQESQQKVRQTNVPPPLPKVPPKPREKASNVSTGRQPPQATNPKQQSSTTSPNSPNTARPLLGLHARSGNPPPFGAKQEISKAKELAAKKLGEGSPTPTPQKGKPPPPPNPRGSKPGRTT